MPRLRSEQGMVLALSALCENPVSKTGLTTLFHSLVSESVSQFKDLEWVVFLGPGQEWRVDHPRVRLDRSFSANDFRFRRLIADHFLVSRRAERHGAQALVTVGFVPLRKRLRTITHVLSLHHLNNRGIGRARAIYRRLASSSWSRADMIITNSHQTKEEVLSRYPRLSSRLMVSYEGLDVRAFHPDLRPADRQAIAEQFGLQPGFLLWASNFYAYKRVDQVLRAFARLDPSLRRRHPLVLVGGDWGGGRQRAEDLASRLGVGTDARFLRWVEDDVLPSLFRTAAAYVLATEEETFGRSVIEAMACGTPCVVSDLPITRETTQGAIDLIDFEDVDVAKAVLHDVLVNGRAGTRGARIAAARRFSFERLARERIMAIRRLLGDGADGG